MNFETASLGLIGIDNAGTGTPLQTWDVMLKEFGAYTPQMGYIPNPNARVEVTEEDILPGGYVRTPMLELTKEDYNYVATNGIPYHGMPALGDCGEVYEYDSFGQLFTLFGQAPKRRRRRRKSKRPTVSKISRSKGKAKPKLVKKKKGLQQVIKKTDTGAIVKVKDTEAQVAMKLVKPLLESFNYYAKMIAPVAAIFPGYGPVIAQLAKLPKPGKPGKKPKKPMKLSLKKKAALATKKARDKKKAKAERMRKSSIARRKAKERLAQKAREDAERKRKRAEAIRNAMRAQAESKLRRQR
jgi:hypothetical protein